MTARIAEHGNGGRPRPASRAGSSRSCAGVRSTRAMASPAARLRVSRSAADARARFVRSVAQPQPDRRDRARRARVRYRVFYRPSHRARIGGDARGDLVGQLLRQPFERVGLRRDHGVIRTRPHRCPRRSEPSRRSACCQSRVQSAASARAASAARAWIESSPAHAEPRDVVVERDVEPVARSRRSSPPTRSSNCCRTRKPARSGMAGTLIAPICPRPRRRCRRRA